MKGRKNKVVWFFPHIDHEGNSEKRNSSGKIPGMFKENPSPQKPAEFEVFPSHSLALCSLKSLGLSINILNYSV